MLLVLIFVVEANKKQRNRARLPKKEQVHLLTKSAVGSDQDDPGCQMSVEELAKLMGPAFNPRYMSITEPADRHSDPSSMKRGAEQEKLRFAVDDTFAQQISDQPAWEVDFVNSGLQDRSSYLLEEENEEQLDDSSSNYKEATEEQEDLANRDLRWAKWGQPTSGGGGRDKLSWDCEMDLKWTDLGEDYFPRYLQTVNCGRTRCFNDRYRCKPKSFTLKFLRRHPGKCVNRQDSGNGGTNSRWELWTWEERAVTFCCECG